MMKHLTAVLLLLLAAVFACPAAAAERTVVFAMDATWPPASQVDKNKNIVGFEPDLIKAMAAAGGFEARIVNVTWEGIFVGLASGEYDAICSSVSITEQRRATVDFSIPYFEVRQVVTVPAGSPISSVKDLAGKVLASQIGTTGYFASQRMPGVAPKTYDEIGLAFEDLKNGRVDAVICDDPVAAAFVLGIPEFKGRLRIAMTVDSPEKEYLGIAVKKGDRDTLDLINRSLKAVAASGEFDRLKAKWFAPAR